MEEYPDINIRLAIHRQDMNLIPVDSIQPRFYTPGEEITGQPDFLR